jgi:hypothetical protein
MPIIATPLARRPGPGAEFPQAVLADRLPPSTSCRPRRRTATQAAVALGIFSSFIH